MKPADLPYDDTKAALANGKDCVVMVGPRGCGKSTWARENGLNEIFDGGVLRAPLAPTSVTRPFAAAATSATELYRIYIALKDAGLSSCVKYFRPPEGAQTESAAEFPHATPADDLGENVRRLYADWPRLAGKTDEQLAAEFAGEAIDMMGLSSAMFQDGGNLRFLCADEAARVRAVLARDEGDGPPPVDCRAPWSGRGVLISDTTALLLVSALRELQRGGGLKAANREGAEVLMRLYDEADLIERDVAGLEREEA